LVVSGQARKEAEKMQADKEGSVGELAEDLNKFRAQSEDLESQLNEKQNELTAAKQEAEDSMGRITAEAEVLSKQRDDLLEQLKAMQESRDNLRSMMKDADLKTHEASLASDAHLMGSYEKDTENFKLRSQLDKIMIERDEATSKMAGLNQKIAGLELISKDRDTCLMELEEVKAQRDESIKQLGTAELKIKELTQLLQEKEDAMSKLAADLEAALSQNNKIRLFTEQRAEDWEVALAKNKEELERLTLEIQTARRQRDEMQGHVDAAEKMIQELRRELSERDTKLNNATRKSLQDAEEHQAVKDELDRQFAQLAQEASEKESDMNTTDSRRELLLKWVKAQRAGLSLRCDTALDNYYYARVFDLWRRLVVTTRFTRLAKEAKERVQAAADSAAMDARRAAEYEQEAEKNRRDVERLRRELRDVQGRLSEVEKLKEVDIKLEIMTRERRIRELLDQRPESLPLMPDSPQFPSPPSGDPSNWAPGSARSLRGQQQRSVSQCTQLPPTNHFGRAAEGVRTTPMPARPHTSMDGHGTSRNSDWAQNSMRDGNQSRSPEGSRQARHPVQHTAQPPRSPRQRQAPRGQRGRRAPGRSVPVRRPQVDESGLPADGASDMWAFVNFGTPMTDYVMNAELPLPKPMRRLVARDGQPEAGA